MHDKDKMDSLNEFLELSADELKLYLQQRGQPSSGTHGSLAARALIAHEQGLPVMLSADTISNMLQKDYHALPSDPFKDNIEWSDEVTLFPNTNIGQVLLLFYPQCSYKMVLIKKSV